MNLTPTQLELLAEARLYKTDAGGTWYEHGQRGKAVPKLVELGLVEFRPRSGGVGDYVAPAIKLTEAGNKVADEYLLTNRDKIVLGLQAKIAYIERNLQNEYKLRNSNGKS